MRTKRLQRRPALQDRRVLEAEGLDILCDDCGRSRSFSRERLAGFVTPDTTLNDLGRRLYCTHCQAHGGLGRNIVLSPRWRAAGQGGGSAAVP
jgi:hypothetical protein